MTPLELTSAVTAIANVLACKLTSDGIALLSAVFTQLGNTLQRLQPFKATKKTNRIVLITETNAYHIEKRWFLLPATIKNPPYERFPYTVDFHADGENLF